MFHVFIIARGEGKCKRGIADTDPVRNTVLEWIVGSGQQNRVRIKRPHHFWVYTLVWGKTIMGLK